jgi:hypothetical protein
MDINCPACNKQHHVREQMAGKQARCSCGHVFTIPSVPPPPALTAELSENPLHAARVSDASILFQCKYGLVRPLMWWLMAVSAVVALVAIPAGFLWNEGWTFSRTPVPPWVATLLFEFVGVGMLLLTGYMLAAYILHRRYPQRVAVAETGVILPKYKLSTEEYFLPWDQVRVNHWGGPISNIDFKLGRLRTVRLVSVQFPTDKDFETFLNCLRQQGKL